MAMNNELNPSLLLVDVGTQAASISLPGFSVSKATVIKSVKLINQTALAADDTNYLQVQLKKTSDNSVLAEVSTKLTGGDGPLVANVGLDSGTPSFELAAGDSVYVGVVKNGTGVPTLASLQIEMYAR